MRNSYWLRPLATRLNSGRKRRLQPRPTARPRLESLEDRCLPSVTINEFLISPSSRPTYIQAGPDGSMWFIEQSIGTAGVLGRITPTGQITEQHFGGEGIASFTFGTDGNIWIGGGTDIYEFTPQGALLHDYLIPSTLNTFYHALKIALGPDGNIWYGEGYAASEVIGRLTPAGQICEFPTGFQVDDITTGPDGNLWFEGEGHGIGRVTPTGNVTMFNPDNNQVGGATRGLTSGPNGNLWMAVPGGNVIEEVNTAGQLVAMFSIPYGAYWTTPGPDGDLWFTSNTIGVDYIGTITPQGSIIEYATPTLNSGVGTIALGRDGNIWFNEYNAGKIGEVVLNQPPANVTPSLGATTINEGQSATLGVTFTDPDPQDTHTAVVSWGDGSANTTVNLSAGVYSVSGLSHTYQDNLPGNAAYTVTATVADSSGQSASGTTSLTVLNVPPTVGAITAPTAPVPVNTAISASAAFTDPGVLDTHTALWSWGDGSTSADAVTESNGSGSVSGSHTYTADGVYTVTLTVTDKDGGAGASSFSYVVVYNPSAGFTTGGGWFTSPGGAYAANPSLTGKANFGFNARYQSGATVPTGDTEFQFPAASLNLHSTSYDWLVITTNQAQFQGSGTINGSGNYGFLVTAQDNGGTTPDLIRMEIWDKGNNNAVVYDTQPGAATTAAPTTALGGGRIHVHTNAQLAAAGAGPGGTAPAPLTPEELRPIVREAIARWQEAGISPAQVSALSRVAVGIAEFPGPWLGMAVSGAVWIDQTAAGHGWYIDPTPADDSEFPASPGGPAYGKIDLLTVVEHELGHELGYGDTDGSGLMGVFLGTGERRVPGLDQPAGPSASPAPASLTSPPALPLIGPDQGGVLPRLLSQDAVNVLMGFAALRSSPVIASSVASLPTAVGPDDAARLSALLTAGTEGRTFAIMPAGRSGSATTPLDWALANVPPNLVEDMLARALSNALSG
jgi:streptogramin lyase